MLRQILLNLNFPDTKRNAWIIYACYFENNLATIMLSMFCLQLYIDYLFTV